MDSELIIAILSALLAAEQILPHTPLKGNSTAQLVVNILRAVRDMMAKKKE